MILMFNKLGYGSSAVLCFILCLWSGISYGYDPSTDISSGAQINSGIKHPYYRESGKGYDLYMSSGVYIFTLHTGLTTTRFPQGTTAKSLQQKYGFSLIVNGGYFTYDAASTSFLPAGKIIDGLTSIRSMVKEFFHSSLDPNLGITINYDKQNNTMTLSDTDFIVPKAHTYTFYAGPQLINSGQINTSINRTLSHRKRAATRTFIIIDKDGQPHLGVSIKGYSLIDLATKIKSMNIFYGQYQVINLDGGSSTSLAAGSRYWSSNKKLPRFFAVK